MFRGIGAMMSAKGTGTQAPLFPLGVVHVFGGCNPPNGLSMPCFTDLPTLDMPFVNGMRVRPTWELTQPNASGPNWSDMDSVVSISAAHGKWVGMSIAAGQLTPDWVYTGTTACMAPGTTPPVGVPGCIKLPRDPAATQSQKYLPVFWNPDFLSQWQTFINAWGARYNNNPAVRYIVLTGFMQNTEAYLSDTPYEDSIWNAQAVADGFADKSEAYQYGARTIISYFMSAFSNKKVIFTDARIWSGGNASIPDRDALKAWGRSTYPRQWGEQTNGAHAVLPVNQGPPDPRVSYSLGSQETISSVNVDPGGAKSFYKPPLDAASMPPQPQPMIDYMTEQDLEARQYAEIYDDDLVLPTTAAVMEEWGPILAGNVAP